LAADCRVSVFPQFTRFYIAFRGYNVPVPKAPFVTKVCPGCGVEKPRSDYYKKSNTVSHKCKPCSLADSRTRAPKYFGKYRESQNGWRFARYQSDAAFREKIAEQKKAAYDNRKDAANAARRERWANDPMCPERLTYRRKDVKDRTPPWVSKADLLAFYAACPKGMEVDHIVPLKGLIDGRPVCGMHVPWNLQYLTPAENRKKKNRISETSLPVP
jgi:hypothetical protein